MKLKQFAINRIVRFARVCGYLIIPFTLFSAMMCQSGWSGRLLLIALGGMMSTAFHLLASSLPTIWDIRQQNRINNN